MKNFKNILVFVLTLIAPSLYAQQWIRISPPGHYVSDVCFVTEKQGWFLTRDTSVYNKYSLMETHNGGINWDTVYVFLDGAKIQGLQMVDSLNGFLKFDNYPEPIKYMRTVDGGFTWQDQGPLALSNDYFFVNADTGFCDVGPDLYKTTNAGLTWVNISLPADPDPSTPEIESYSLYKIFFVDELHGWLCGCGWMATYIFYTCDGGTSWQVIDQVAAGACTLNFSDTLHGSFISFMTFHTGAYSTSDNFLTKQLILDDIDTYSVYSQNDSTILLGFLSKNMILRTTDSGQSFDTLVPEGFKNIPFIIYDFKFFGSTGYAFGNYIFKYTDTLNTSFHDVPFAEKRLSLYPNPSGDNVTLKISADKPETVQLTLYSTAGVCVKSATEKLKPGENRIGFSVKDLDSGVYFLNIKGQSIAKTAKVIVMH